ncbi:MAG: S8 family serine peptidase [Actinomycetia bacterium]|nr:S8 family serine peptidase [Actinomycetes bacterium]
MSGRTTIGLLVAASFLIASCGGGGVEETASGPMFPRSDAPTWADVESDGFHHLVIDLTAVMPSDPVEAETPTTTATTTATTTTTAHESDGTTRDEGSAAVGGELPPPTATTLLPVGSDESVHVYSNPDGSLWALLESGDRVPVALGRDGLVFALIPEDEPAEEAPPEDGDQLEADPNPVAPITTTTTTEPPPPAPPPEPEIVLELRNDPDVRSIVALGDGTWSVVTSLTADQLEARTDQPVRTDALLALATEDRHYDEQWSLANPGTDGIEGVDIGYEGARELGDGTGIVVAVIDSGIDFSHPDLLPARWTNEDETSCTNGLDDDNNGFADDCHGWDFVQGDPTGYDLNAHWHGTHVAGIIAAAAGNDTGIAGVAPGAQIMDLRVVDTTTTGVATVAAAIRYAVDNGADVINTSLASPPGGVTSEDVAELAAALDHALDHDVLVVAAAGNDATNIDHSPVWPASFPHPNLVTVAASTWFDSGASFSNRGPTSVDLFAPGSEVLSTSPRGRYRRADGTSVAAPHVAGTAALVRGAAPTLDAIGVRDRLLATVDPGSGFTRGSLTGGRLNAAQAMAGGPGPRLTFTFSGLASLTAGDKGAATITATVDENTELEGYELGWTATLVTRVEGTTYVVVDHPVGTGAGPSRSGDDGRIVLSAPSPVPTAPVELSLSTQLPAGDYALIMETTLGGHPGLLVGSPRVELFTIAPGTGTTPSTTTPIPTGTTPEPEPDQASPDPDRPIDPPPAEPVPDPKPEAVSFPIENGEWRIDSLSPAVGSVGGGGHVTIAGHFPDTTFVWIGDTPVNVLAVSNQQLIVDIPRRPEPGVVDVSLRTSADGIVLEAPGVFTFLGENDTALADDQPDPLPTPATGDGPEGQARPLYELGPVETHGELTLAPPAPGGLVWLERIWAN